MKKGTRRILFWLAAFIFVFSSWAAIRYAQGYAYDFDSKTFVRTGAVAVTVSTSATLYIGELKAGDTSFIGNRAGKEGLLPGVYELRVAHDGYTTWRKSISVQEGQLTDFPHILILPTDDEAILDLKAEASASLNNAFIFEEALMPTPRSSFGYRNGGFLLREGSLLDMRTGSSSLIAEHVLGFATSGDQQRLLWWTRNEIWVLWLSNTDQQPYRVEGERQAITRFSVRIARASWFRDNEHIVVDLGNESYRILEVDGRGGTNIINL